jgi:cytoskeletal protein CcmA (bactofilin family)
MIKGKVSGIVRSDSDLYIDEKAVVEADIVANIVSVKGSVKGNISATEKVELFACASVDGDVVAPQITMETGCRFNGACRMEAPKIRCGRLKRRRTARRRPCRRPDRRGGFRRIRAR